MEEGEIVLGALHMVHERSDDKVCGKIMDQGGIQALEAMLYTLDHINGKFGEMLIPGVRIGVLAKDDCDTDIFGLEQALDFIRAKPQHKIINYSTCSVSTKLATFPSSLTPRTLNLVPALSQLRREIRQALAWRWPA